MQETTVDKSTVIELASRMKIELQQNTIELLDKYKFKPKTTIKTSSSGEIKIETYENRWQAVLTIKQDGSCFYCCGYNWF